jgi:hypothetical protein
MGKKWRCKPIGYGDYGENKRKNSAKHTRRRRKRGRSILFRKSVTAMPEVTSFLF